MHFTLASVLSLGLVTTTYALPGCSLALAPTLTQPQNAAEVIITSALTKWAKSTGSSYVSSKFIDASHTFEAPYSIKFKAGIIDGFLTNLELSSILDGWLESYLVGGGDASDNDFKVMGITCTIL
ncbi:hypothetical protein GGR57DRAFT_506417 [Xylariaceae sp. FL1272]|nr:hypothetical protein GGR57DRAFT_506417 [Xylariaceae sp. FL1272]